MLLLSRLNAALFAVLIGNAWAQAWKNQVNISMCNWAQLRANTIRDTIYLDGGSLWWQLGFSDGTTSLENNDNEEGFLYSLNLSTKFNTATANFTDLLQKTSKAGGAANNIAPTYRDGVMFANDNEFYLYGGLIRLTDSQDPPAADTVLGYERYQYGPYRSSWQPGFISENLPENVTRYITNGAGVSAPSENLGFYFSGMRGQNWGPITYNDESANTTADTLITVDMSTMRQEVWSNSTLPDYVPGRANAELVWVPVSQSGILVAIGGVVSTATILYSSGLNQSQEQQSKQISPTFMETLSVYDVAAQTWYLQNTTGDVPPQLTQFCSVLASASDGSSHNIYIYGGYDGLSSDDKPSDDVYVLSLPTFTWIKAYSGNTTHGRTGHRCIKPYPDQMLVLGGLFVDASQCIDGGIVQVFNLNSLRFQEIYDPTQWTDYQVPGLVSTRIGGDSKGGATKTAPSSWNNNTLSDVFKASYTKTIATWYPYNATSTSAVPNPTVSSIPNKGSNFPGWAGAVLGVVLGLVVILAAAVCWLLWRRKKYKNEYNASEAGDSSNRNRVLKWMYGSGSGLPKSNETTTSTELGTYHTTADESEFGNVSMSTAVSPNPNQSSAHEAAGTPVYEIQDTALAPPVELPTPFNTMSEYTRVSPGPSPSPIISPVTAQAPEGSSNRPAHHRHVSSFSAPSIDDVVGGTANEDGDRNMQRPHYVSDVSQMTVSSEGEISQSARNSRQQPKELSSTEE